MLHATSYLINTSPFRVLHRTVCEDVGSMVSDIGPVLIFHGVVCGSASSLYIISCLVWTVRHKRERIWKWLNCYSWTTLVSFLRGKQGETECWYFLQPKGMWNLSDLRMEKAAPGGFWWHHGALTRVPSQKRSDTFGRARARNEVTGRLVWLFHSCCGVHCRLVNVVWKHFINVWQNTAT